jgi:isopenicillin N synthase-like dioxygenase
MYSFWRDWFAQPDEAKRHHLRSPGRGGWYPPGSESPGYDAVADTKEYFHVRAHHCELDAATWDVWVDCYGRAQRWLFEHDLPELAALDVNNHVLRVLRYPPTSDGAVGAAHCDFDLLTVTVPATAAGLEAWSVAYGAGAWGPAEPHSVHVGEMLAHYTRNYRRVDPLLATPHRVRVAPNTERLSAAFFWLPPGDFVLRPGLTAADYLRETLTKAGTASVGTPGATRPVA